MIPLDAVNSSIPCACSASPRTICRAGPWQMSTCCDAPKRGRQRRRWRRARCSFRRLWPEPQSRRARQNPAPKRQRHRRQRHGRHRDGQIGRSRGLRASENSQRRRRRSRRSRKSCGWPASRGLRPTTRDRWPGSPPRGVCWWPTARRRTLPEAVAALRSQHRDFEPVATVFEDFERKTYEGWTITGDAFGKGPSHGTEAGQQPVTGFAGRGLVNTFIGGDGPQGTATSKKFTIERRYIGFLIGGGNLSRQDCMNLLVGGKHRPHGDGQNARSPRAGELGCQRVQRQGSGDRNRRPQLGSAGDISTSIRSFSPTSRPSRCW